MTLLTLLRTAGEHFRRLDGEGDLSLTDLSVLAGIERGFDLPSLLARTLHLDFARVSRVTELLHRLGYVAREIDPADRRRCRLRLTDAGRERLQRGRADLTRVMAGLGEGLTDDERAGLEQALDGVRRVLRALAQDEPDV
jgi:DNA-binding MarR family transcriptional regulator